MVKILFAGHLPIKQCPIVDIYTQSGYADIMEHLAAFKAVYGKSIRIMMSGLDKYFPDMETSGKQDFI